MAEYTRKDEIFLTDDPRLKNAIGKEVYAANIPTNLLSLARSGLWTETLAVIKEDVDSCPFATFVEGFGYKHYDAIIIKKDDNA